MIGQGLVSLTLAISLANPSAPAPERPLAVTMAAQAQAADSRLQVRPSPQTEPTAKPAEPGMSRGKKIAIAVGIVAGAVLLWAALDDSGDNNTSGGSGGGY